MEDTICAISTSMGIGAISIIRVSGPDAVNIVNQIFKSSHDLTKVASHTIHYGYIVDGSTSVDEVLVSVMLAPKTFTTEDTVEINCHGGIAPTNKVLELLLSHGCRLADRGEFTKRAFLNGRIDLLEAEAVMDMINAQTDSQRELAMNQITGRVSNLINDLREDLISIISNINVNIDYPEYDDVTVVTNDILLPKVQAFKTKIAHILAESRNGQIIKEGIKTSIIGRPNVGKSSLLNALLDEEKAIVTDIAGTTRDIVEGEISLNGIPLHIIDTAGIRQTEDKVESIGVEKSLKTLANSDLVLLLLNNNEPLSREDEELFKQVSQKNYLVVINKCDLPNKLDISSLSIDPKRLIRMSISQGTGLDDLKNKIIELFNLGSIATADPTYLSNARCIGILENCLHKMEEIEEAIKNNQPIDMLELDIRLVWEDLGRINGTTYEEELLDEMFSRFCLGK